MDWLRCAVDWLSAVVAAYVLARCLSELGDGADAEGEGAGAAAALLSLLSAAGCAVFPPLYDMAAYACAAVFRRHRKHTSEGDGTTTGGGPHADGPDRGPAPADAWLRILKLLFIIFGGVVSDIKPKKNQESQE